MKESIRKIILKNRDLQDRKTILKKSDIALDNIFNSGLIDKNMLIFMFVGFGSEIQTLEYIENLVNDGYKVCIPKVNKITKKMDIYQFTSREMLEESKFGILEPTISSKLVNPEEIMVTITPGVAFSKDGYRIGYGGGFYDKFYFDYPNSIRIGVCFSLQIVDTLEYESHDAKVNYIATEFGIQKINSTPCY
jgi:5-formyltetrahydrofolate cyclo-ligase